MTNENHHKERASEKTLADLYHAAVSIEEKVEEIIDGLQELIETQRDRNYRGYDWGYDYKDYDID